MARAIRIECEGGFCHVTPREITRQVRRYRRKRRHEGIDEAIYRGDTN
jgi:hypothetical protein